MNTKNISAIRIADGVRIGYVVTNEGRHAHGLGVVGEPLLPYMGLRAQGYALSLGTFPPDVFTLDVEALPDERGYYPKKRLPWADLDAPDVPLSHWLTDQESVDAENVLADAHDVAAATQFGPRS